MPMQQSIPFDNPFELGIKDGDILKDGTKIIGNPQFHWPTEKWRTLATPANGGPLLLVELKVSKR